MACTEVRRTDIYANGFGPQDRRSGMQGSAPGGWAQEALAPEMSVMYISFRSILYTE